jgi:hypothetical protein
MRSNEVGKPLRGRHSANRSQDAFEEFLTTFKSSASATESSATHALEGLNIGDDENDEYDFMDDAANPQGTTARGGAADRDPKKKYMEILQRVVDRQISEICVELDDLDAVGTSQSRS